MLVNTKPNQLPLQKPTRQQVIDLAKQFSFEIDFERENTHLVRFKRDEDTEDYVRVDVWFLSGTVGIYSKKFKAEHGSRYFYQVDVETLAEMFSNPYLSEYER